MRHASTLYVYSAGQSPLPTLPFHTRTLLTYDAVSYTHLFIDVCQFSFLQLLIGPQPLIPSEPFFLCDIADVQVISFLKYWLDSTTLQRGKGVILHKIWKCPNGQNISEPFEIHELVP